MFRAITCYLRGLSKKEYSMLREMCGYANNLFNKGLYEVRQHYFSTGKYLRYESNYHKCKSNENYTMLQAQTAQYVLKRVDWAMMSFFACLKKAKAGEYEFERVKLPRYYKKGGLSPLIFPAEHGGCRITDGVLNIPQSHVFFREHGCHRIRIKLPPQLLNAKIKEVHIIPVSRGRAFKIQYVYMCEPEPLNLNPDNALAIDLGLDNLCACVSSDGATFIMDGRKIKSTNHHYNKQRARLQAVDIKQKAHTGRLLRV